MSPLTLHTDPEIHERDGWNEDWGDIDPPDEFGRPVRRARAPRQFGVRWFLSAPQDKGHTGTMPAGVILVVGLAALVLLALLSAPATLRKSNAKDKGAWRQTTAQAVATISAAFRLDAPRNAIDDARGTGVSRVVTADELLAQQRAATPPVTGPTVTQAVSQRPVVRAPAQGAPLKLWLGGDSITGAFGPEAQKVLESSGLFSVTVESKPSSGLTRPDYLNWPKRLLDIANTDKPDVMVVMFGANDAQNMPINGPAGYALYDENWLAEYRKRVASTMDLLKSPANDRLVVWVGALPMGPASGVRGMEKVDYVYWSEAQTRPWVAYLDSFPFFTDSSLNYSLSLPAADGKVQKLRANDNIHLSREGADRLAWVLYQRLTKEIDLSKSNIFALPPSQAAPPTIQERVVLPPPPDSGAA
ncbi:MAG: DUF459 domain-containing protein [Actinobacteria bacterium]|nr:DUF459 domain-containing protein [Actinomycetota bacterium]